MAALAVAFLIEKIMSGMASFYAPRKEIEYDERIVGKLKRKGGEKLKKVNENIKLKEKGKEQINLQMVKKITNKKQKNTCDDHITMMT